MSVEETSKQIESYHVNMAKTKATNPSFYFEA